MNKEYWLIAFATSIKSRKYKLIDKVVCKSIVKAETEFKQRNNIRKLLEKHDLTIAETKRWWI